MTRTTNARIAGFTFLFYIALGVTTLILDRAIRADRIAARVALIAEHATRVRLTVLLTLLTCVTALLLAVSLYGITRDADRDLAVLALSCRIGAGMLGAVAPVTTLGLLWLATGGAPPDGGAGGATLGAFLLQVGQWNTLIAAILFAVGSTLFSWLPAASHDPCPVGPARGHRFGPARRGTAAPTRRIPFGAGDAAHVAAGGRV